MEAKVATSEYRLSQWTATIRECRTSGMTAKAWCLQNGIKETQYYYWLHKIRSAVSTSIKENEPPSPCFVPLLKSNDSKHSSLEVQSSFQPDIKIRLGNVTLEATNQANPELLSIVLKELAHVQ